MNEMIDSIKAASIPLPTSPGIRDTDMEIDYEEEAGTGERNTSEERMPRQGFFSLLKGIVATNYKTMPKRLVKDVIWLGPLAAIWIGLWSLNAMTMMSLPGPVSGLAWAMIFLTATYNGLVGKAAFITVMSRTFVPMIKRIRAGELPEIRDRYSRTAAMLKSAFAASKRYSLKICLAGAGFGLIASNILTRNNKIDKYFICVLCAVALFDDLSKGQGSVVVRLTAAALRDLPVMAGRRFNVTVRSTYLSMAGFAIGLVLAIVPGQFVNSFNSPAGAVAGALLLIAGLALHLTEGRNASKQE